MPRVFDHIFTKSQRKALSAFTGGPREHEAQNITNLLLERKGLLRRRSGPRPARLLSHPVIEWEITPEGQAMLHETDDLCADRSPKIRLVGSRG